ncbi:hypothetical protein AtubIFM57258_000661 [Aspergillus tubingensis]|uniref:Uncharacterized protein n=1 Tax=Aspergillus costaricaensis CBS 115574 TaxID=1448317 RepID=A0ACD1IRY6_9EURO|nr:hypothetical protein BO79DRAFT_285364 [Aspergillus costaricaensis CBS 115574]RAK92437.1 hypothetical protein BO79DRAFT_285364 [Aspergillus costaricaensis CBS 115574]GLB05381.1 hypothetical protein AtubIFM57258_000661 [Aspergillus tubingensis]
MSAVAEFLHLPTTVVRRAPRLSAGISQLTNRPAMPGKLAAISHGKLQREAASQTPDLRRCLGHHNILIRCVKAAQEDNARVMKETYEDDPDLAPTSEESEFPPIRTQITNAVKTMVRSRRTTTADKPSDDGLVRVEAHGPETTIRSKRRGVLATMLGLKGKGIFRNSQTRDNLRMHSAF